MANLNNWEPIEVQKIIDDQSDRESGKLCYKTQVVGTGSISWQCGLPKTGTAGFGMSSFHAPDPAPGFTPGWCTMHVVQHQRNELGVGNEYEFDVIIKDVANKDVGGVQLAAIDPITKALSVSSQLQWTVDIIAAGDGNAPVVFKYGGQTCQNGDGSHQSTSGNGPENGFADGNREGDMGFDCCLIRV
ncbi:hypothetical protein EJ02DRAFT_427783 [Clathrospora elynae]|uniref:Uncharacterized protein n=1 Tax=Clathrospora elynae TaxID=706981 RepID=A0A6A5S8M1_9PLEO|nr:hypothetical protein EJ02DRAFT_427783 [Clathrospora elynae]